MDRAFVDLYNQELALLYERGAQFAEDHPEIAMRLGGLLQGKTDPAVAGLLEGTAFLAARVQAQIAQEFSTFTTELIEQLIPNLLAPTPSVVLLEAAAGEKDGKRFPPGSYIEAVSRERDTPITCRFRLSAPLVLTPFVLTEARALRGATEFQAMGLEVVPQMAGGLILRLALPGGGTMGAVTSDRLTVHLAGDPADAASLYEMIFAGMLRLTLRWRDRRDRVCFRTLPKTCVQPVGFDADERLFPEDGRVFRGYALLREFFIFPFKFMGFRIDDLPQHLAGIDAEAVEVVIETDRLPTNPARIDARSFRLNAVPAINLFQESCSSVKPDGRRHEYLVVPDSSPASHFEVHRVLDAWGHYGAGNGKVAMHPLYSLPLGVENPREALFFTTRRRPRRVTTEERRQGRMRTYPGTETVLSFYEPATLDSPQRLQRLQLRLLCSNRHLPLMLPPGKGTEFRLNDDVTVALTVVHGPMAPKGSILDLAGNEPHRSGAGQVHWRLISYLSMNLLGLADGRDGGAAGEHGAAALREILSLYTDLSDHVTERQIGAIRSMTTRPTTRSIRRGDGHYAARGTEITLSIDERPFDGSGILPFCAVIDRFLSDHAGINSFSQLVVTSQQRGAVKTFPPRTGQGPLL